MSDQNLLSVNIPETDKPRVVIIGGGFGGIRMVRHLDNELYQVVLLDRYNYHTFQPLLYQVATAGLEPDSIAGPLRKVTKHYKNTYFRMLKVNRIDPENKTLKTSAGTLHYDYLIVATGARINYFGNKSIAEHGFPVKQVTHALDLRSHIFQQFEKSEFITDEKEKERLMTFVVVGAGPTGVEVCGALAELKNNVLPKDYPQQDMNSMRIFLIEGENRVIPAMSDKSGNTARKYLEKMGVEIILNCRTTSYDGNVVHLDNGQEIESETLIWAAGVRGNLIKGFGEESIKKGKLLVDETNHVFSNFEKNETYECIFAIGDIAFMQHKKYPGGLPGLAQPAIQQGTQLAKNLNAVAKGKTMKSFKYLNKGVLATVGRNKAVADLPGNIKLHGTVGWMIWMVVHLLFLIGFRSKAVVFANWSWNYITYDRGIRLILRPSSKKNDTVSKEMIEEMLER
jgi:NADH:ubiquinone reductase (H+-translocating)